ncbi:S8 family serine peptidase [Actinomadura barringtoniae]|uniref:S8 family serine peptidase n=1 Tax=Actinomadura barringtoniae TaxID=1427535 RepID=A0A939TG72_9ACTN|nr:S8 family serine peptidase [Actinomadura barringtoniae]MBO2455140.1 S8 family serine peptidase [Actinomadura barringtoniae]
MLSRRLALPLATGLLVALAPPLARPAQADPVEWARRLGNDYLQAQQVTRGKGVTVALLGDGVASGVHTLDGRLAKEKDFVHTPHPKRVFGTLIATYLAGSGPTSDSPFGVRGLAPAVRVLPVRIEASSKEAGFEKWNKTADWDDIIAKGIRYAADQKADVIVLLPGDEDRWGLIRSAVAYALSKNAVIIASSSNDDAAGIVSPRANAGVIGVAALNAKGKRDGKMTTASTRTFVAAPGFKQPTTGPGNDPWTFWGGGPAVTWVAAAVALVKAEYPKLTPPQVEQAIALSARNPKGRGRYDTDIGFGIVNPDGALKEARTLAKAPPSAPPAQPAVLDTEHFGGKPSAIRAVPYNPVWIGGFGALMLAGLASIVVAVRLFTRRRS